MTTHGRYVGVPRLSQDKDASTSIQRQTQAIESFVDAPGFPGLLVGRAKDVNVSGGLSPFRRPQLGRWLTRRVEEFDGITAMDVDRLTRRARHFSGLLDWARENGKRVICVSEGYDSEDPHTRTGAQDVVVFGEAFATAFGDHVRAGEDAQHRNALLREYGVSVRVWRDLVPWAKYSVVIDFGDITGMAKAMRLRLPDGTDRLVVRYRCGEDDIPQRHGSPATVVDHGWTDERKRGLLGAVAPPGRG